MRPRKSKTQLEASALELFYSQGFSETSIRDLAAKANIAEGTLYRHYPSKEAFARHLYQNAAARIAQDIQTIHNDSGDMESALSGIVIYFCGLFDEERPLFSFVLLSPPPTLKQLDVATLHPVRVLAEVLEQWFQRRSLHDRLPLLVSAEIVGVIASVATHIQLGTLKNTMTSYAEDMMLAVFRVLKP